ncbi:TPA: hypothetical protein QBF70_005203, partial [Escherichia coli O113:H4]|nr:hypothetical protein [Escherichia coli O113:H4]
MDKIQDTKAAWQALQEDEVMRKIAIERLVEGFHELEELIKNYPVKIQEQNNIYFENLRNDINNITEAINSLPDA